MRINSAVLASAWESARSTPQLGRNLVLLLVTAVGIAASSLWVLSQMSVSSPFQERFQFSAEFDEAPAINPEARQKVTIAGVEVGTVEDWHTTADGSAVIDLSIDSEYQVHEDARVVVRTVNPLNAMFIEINPGTPGTPMLEKGATIPSSSTESPIQADAVLKHLDENQQQALTSILLESDAALARGPRDLPAGLRGTTETLVDLKPVVEQLQLRRARIEKLVTAMAAISSAVGENNDRATRLVGATGKTLDVLGDNSDDLRSTLRQLPSLSTGLRDALTSTQELTGELDPTLSDLDAAADDLPAALKKLSATAEELESVARIGRPVVAKARPIVADLRPLVGDLDVALRDARPITRSLRGDSRVLVSYLSDLQAFIYNTASVFSLKDGRGHFVRGHVVVPLPDGGVAPGNRGGYAPGPENGLGGEGQGQ